MCVGCLLNTRYATHFIRTFQYHRQEHTMQLYKITKPFLLSLKSQYCLSHYGMICPICICIFIRFPLLKQWKWHIVHSLECVSFAAILPILKRVSFSVVSFSKREIGSSRITLVFHFQLFQLTETCKYKCMSHSQLCQIYFLKQNWINLYIFQNVSIPFVSTKCIWYYQTEISL